MTGYQVTNQVKCGWRISASWAPALDALVAAGANQINGMNFSIHDPAALLAEARAEAVADARAKAETYAKAAGVTLGPILSISENGNGGPRPMVFAAPMAKAASVPVALGRRKHQRRRHHGLGNPVKSAFGRMDRALRRPAAGPHPRRSIFRPPMPRRFARA